MSDNSSLPRPNLPGNNQIANQSSGQGSQVTANDPSQNDVDGASQVEAGQTSQLAQSPSVQPTPPSSSPPSPSLPLPQLSSNMQGTNQASSIDEDLSTPPNPAIPVSLPTSSGGSLLPTPLSSPIMASGLDSQHPGGSLPSLNDQGQVIGAATISDTRQTQSFDQPNIVPESSLQHMQAKVEAAADRSSQNTTTAPMLPVGSQAASGQNQQQALGDLASQQEIKPTVSAQDQARVKAGSITHPSLGTNVPGLSMGSDQAGSDFSELDSLKSAKDKKKGKKSKKADDSLSAVGPQVAKPKLSLPKILSFVLIGVLLIGGAVFGISRFTDKSSSPPTSQSSAPSSKNDGSSEASTGKKTNVVLSYWGLWEPSEVFAEVLADFESETGISVDYRQQSHKDYRTRLQSAIASGSGPDVFRYHATWASMLREELAPLPAKIMSMADFQQAFYPIFSQQLQLDGQLVGIPLMYDGLALYYNEEILQMANEEPPATWGELRTLAEKLTVRSDGVVQRGGIAIGNTENVDHFSDILGLLIYQNGGDPANPLTGEVRDAIDFYASFSRVNPVYSTSLPSSTMAFARGDVAMMMAPSWRAHEIKSINPELKFNVAPVPKLGDNDFGWANYWAEGVNKKSSNQEEAWMLLKYLSSKDVLLKLHSAQSEIRAFGEIFPRKDMAQETNSQLVKAYLADAPQGKSWYLCSRTHDVGINDQMIEYYQDAINIAIQGKLQEKDLQTLSQGVSQVLQRFGAKSSSSTSQSSSVR